MDFKSLLNAANKNAKKANKTLNELESEVHKEKNSVRDQLEAEKRARAEILRRKAEQKKAADKRKEEERAKSFVIPKKKDEGTVDPNKVKAYFERQEQEKREKAKQAEVEKERLMKLRMQAHGGKATKKLGKHFGLNPIDLQIRFGGNNEHVETLQKRQWREEEELDREADRYRNGVFKALQTKKKVEEQVVSRERMSEKLWCLKENTSLMANSIFIERHQYKEVFTE
ncbi:unnamed protein product [Caenorhabditis auriculariae]|uniref:Uncharacterized protein n=1 Tax=Caenorhabditis auriculariae TaxID=2777116 RepID=A0A8S1HP22_9PELO|nr:unnamed protein product [Caenorhabditis auriculariae]